VGLALAVYGCFAWLVRYSKKLGEIVVRLNNEIQSYVTSAGSGSSISRRRHRDPVQGGFLERVDERADQEHRAYCVRQFIKNSVEPLAPCSCR